MQSALTYFIARNLFILFSIAIIKNPHTQHTSLEFQ